MPIIPPHSIDMYTGRNPAHIIPIPIQGVNPESFSKPLHLSDEAEQELTFELMDLSQVCIFIFLEDFY